MYGTDFFDTVTPDSLRSAEIVLPGILKDLDVQSVIDIGCGAGAWLSVAEQHGCDIQGVDGYAPSDRLLIPHDRFIQSALDDGYDCAGYDLAMCLEVSEHLPSTSAAALVEGLCKADRVLFSPAHPGQGGVGHVNEQWGTWWAELFAAYGYAGTSDLKWRHWTNRLVNDYYRENLLLFARDLDDLGFTPGVVDVIHPQRLGHW